MRLRPGIGHRGRRHPHGSGVAPIARPEGSGDSKRFTGRNERQFRSTRKNRNCSSGAKLAASIHGKGVFIHETPIRFVALAVRVHRLRSRRLCGGRRAATRRSRCPSAVRLGRPHLLRGRVLPRLSGAWILHASSASLAVVAARSAGRCSDGGARSPGRRRGPWLPVAPGLSRISSPSAGTRSGWRVRDPGRSLLLPGGLELDEAGRRPPATPAMDTP